MTRARWTALGLGLVAMVIVAVAVAVVLSRGGGSSNASPPPTAATSASAATASPTAPGLTATPPPVQLASLVSATPGSWRREVVASGAAPSGTSGMFFVSAATGETERWTVTTDTPDRDPSRFLRYWSSADGSWVFAQDDTLTRALYRPSGGSWGWSSNRLDVLAGSGDLLAFEAHTSAYGDDTNPDQRDLAGPVFVVDSTLHEVGRCPVRAAQIGQALFSPDRQHLATIAFFRSGPGPLDFGSEESICDIGTGAIHQLETAPPIPAGYRYESAGFLPVTFSQATGAPLRISYAFTEIDGQRYTWIARTFDWTGTKTNESTWDYPAALDFSPDGTLVAWEERGLAERQGEGPPTWASVVVADATTGKLLFRIRGAWLFANYGDRWLADSSGIVVLTAGDPADHGAGEAPKLYGYQVVARDGSSVRWLPYSSDRWLLVTPSPVNRNLFAVGRSNIYLGPTPRGPVISPDIVAESSSPWVTSGKEIAFTTPLLGHGGISPMVLSDVAIERPPFDDVYSFVVARTGSCLNLRAEPSATSASQGCLPDGTEVTRQPTALPNYEQPTAAIVGGDGRWVHVVSGDGRAGWVSAAYLDWAAP